MLRKRVVLFIKLRLYDATIYRICMHTRLSLVPYNNDRTHMPICWDTTNHHILQNTSSSPLSLSGQP